MLQNLPLLFLLGLATASTANERDFDVISFTQPVYYGVVQEKAVSSVVESDVMMGMWLTNATRDVQFEINGATRGFEASKIILGNFVFLNLRTASVNQAQNVRVRAISAAFNYETFCTVQVSVIDVNDFPPLFPPAPYSVSIDEDSKVGTVITHVKATDSDRDLENTRCYYSLAQFTSDYFAVHPTSGAVILTAPLNAKNQASHSVIIQAIDRKAALAGTAKPKTTTLTVSVNTVNAHSPEIVVRGSLSFDSSYSDSSNRQRGEYAIVQVYDADSGTDGETSMPIVVDCDIPGLFTIEHHRREDEHHLIFTTAPPPMNGAVNVTLEVSDRGHPPRITRKVISIQVFDRRSLVPVFLNDTFTMIVSEISPIATQVGFAAAKVFGSDQASNIRYSIIDGNHEGKFSINTNTSLITTSGVLDRAKKQQYVLTVAAVNMDSIDYQAKNTTVTIVIEDANNHDPIFTNDAYMCSISENAPVGSVLIRVKADDDDLDRNGTVIYSLIEASGLPFVIDSFNGTIYTTGLLDSDTLTKNTFKLRVRASDSGLPFNRKSECFVTVRIVNTNDNPPVFNEVDCAVSIPSSTQKGSKVLQLNSIDIDLNPVSCLLLSGGDGWFEIESATCELRLAADLVNMERHFILRVTASDGKYTSEPVTINVSVEKGLDQITKRCRDTGAIRRFEDSISSLQPASSHLGGKITTNQSNRTSQLPNKYKPTLVPKSSLMIVNVSEDAKVNSVVARVRAFDRDSGYNGKLWFTIAAGNNDSCFIIDTQNGFIHLARPLDRERRSSYRLIIKVSDLGTPPKLTTIRLTFLVTDVNDNSPTFTQNSYNFELPENVTVGYVIQARIQAYDIDEGDNARVRYSLLSDSYGKNSFFINPITGYINVTKELDRETIPQYNLTVIASDSSKTNPRKSTARIIIRLLDVNDNAPRFYQSIYRIRISEDLPKHVVLFWLQANDPDEGENSAIRYTLTDGVTNKNDGRTRFRVDDRTGAIRLKAPLDARVQNRYNITARARDSKKLYSTCYIEVEVLPVNRNLYAPYFSNRYVRVEVAENGPIGTEVGVMSATDEDTTEPERSVAYYIVDGTGLGFFSIDENTGIITTLRTLDRETEQYYWLTVVAEDRAAVPLSGHVFVLVEVTDVNDNAPQPLEPIYFASIQENTPFGSFVTQIKALDKDAGSGANLTYSMDLNKYFSIDASTGIVTSSVAKRRLDRESIDGTQLSFDVRVSDRGSPSLSSSVRVVVNVTDENDNPPVFFKSLKKRYHLPERNRSKHPTPIARVVAHDRDAGKNADIDYVLAHPRKFTINSKTGIISTSSSFKPRQKSMLKISAFDLANKQKQSKIRLEIDWQPFPNSSRFAPTFTEGNNDLQEGCYFEHVDAGFVVDDFLRRNVRLLQAEDIDSDQLWFRIAGGNEADMFDINEDNVLFVAGEPDAEIMDFYNLTIEVTDGHNTAKKQICISICDINDHRPEFTSKVFETSIDENLPPNSRVVQLSVTDGDRSEKNRNFIFKIRGSVDPESAAKFRITSDGTIYTTVQLNREAQREHILFIEVDDQGVPGALQGFAHIVISVADRNEHAPQFTSSSYTAQFFIDQSDPLIGVDETAKRVALRVRATDQDIGENARIFYSILPGAYEQFWKINPSSGEISATKLLVSADAEHVKTSTLVVKATDGGRPSFSSTCQVTIDVKRPSNAAPRFEAEKLSVIIPENAAVGSFVTVVTATASSSITYSLTTGNEDQHFSINPHSGVISLVASLDREQRTNYQLLVACVSTEGANATASVVIDVLDVNDNRPHFLSQSYIGYVSESSGSSTPGPITDVMNQPLVVSASDPDSGNNAQIKYEILDPSNDVARRFSIDINTGAIRTRAGIDLFDYEIVSKYEFKVGCRDMGSPQLFSSRAALVNIHVRDANDTIPAFTSSHYHFKLLLPTAVGMIVSRDVRAAPAVFPYRPRLLSYSITSVNGGSAFKINRNNGVLSVANASVLSDGAVYDLRLRLFDSKRSATAKATIAVSKMTGKKLMFSQDVYEVRVEENSTEVLDLIVPRISTTQLKDNIRFSILNPNPSFSIESTSGLIRTTGVPVDREEKTVYELLVEAINVDALSESEENDLPRGRCKVKVRVTDVNDNPPRFVKSLYHATVQIDAKPSTVVKQVRAVDFDVGENSEVRYSLTGPNATWFDIDARDGLVMLRRTPNVPDGGNLKFNVTLVARDMGTPPLAGRVVMIVSLVNRATPVFTQSYYDGITVSEDAPLHIVVTDAVKASSPDGSDVVYTIEDGDPLQQFDIDFNMGTITTRRMLDHEVDSRYRLRIRARDSQSRAYADAEIEIIVTDVNDNSPIFSQLLYRKSLPETAGVGATVVQIIASDGDSRKNGELSYQIVDDLSSDGGYFHIDDDSGVVWTARDLDYEMKPVLSFVVRANDHGTPMRHTDVMVILTVEDVNDNPPVFQKASYQFEVSSNSKPGHFVGVVSAWDPDSLHTSELIYSMQNHGSPVLAINSTTGVVTLVENKNSPIITNVTVSDGVFTSTSGFFVTFTSDAALATPAAFEKLLYKFSIAENEPAGARVGWVHATGAGDLTYQIESNSNLADLFRIDADSGRLQTAQEIDREIVHQQLKQPTKSTVIEFHVIAIDAKESVARCRVRVKILDRNDNAPVFTQSKYNAIVVPSNRNRDSVVNVTAHDPDAGENSQITYSLHDAPLAVKKHFLLDYSTGEVTIRDSYLPFSNVDELRFFVRATDHGADEKSNVVSVTVYLVSDQAFLPRFSETLVSARLPENAPVGSEVATVRAFTSNNRRITYELAQRYISFVEDEMFASGAKNDTLGTLTSKFRIDSKTGRITTISVLDRETQSRHVINVLAYVKTTPELVASAQILLTVTDVNDNAPLFTSSLYHASVVENSPSQTEVIRVEARDPDEGRFAKVTYSLEEPKGVNLPFLIDRRTGLISTSASLDYENHSRYELIVKATDGSQKANHVSSCTVVVNVIDINDSPPAFSHAIYQTALSESIFVGQRISNLMRITDRDRDGLSPVQLYIINGDKDRSFELILDKSSSSHNNAAVGLKLLKELDREKTPDYLLTILATDGLYSNTTQLRLKIEDVNDNTPVCEQLVYYAIVLENFSLDLPIIRLQASDADAGENGKIRYDLSGERSSDFRVDPLTGDLFPAVVLDRESSSRYLLTAAATDGGGKSCEVQISIIVDDVNDEPPAFEPRSLKGATKENTPINSLIHRVLADDGDRGRNGTLTFSLVNNVNGQFYMEPKTGVIVLKKPLDRETVSSYQLQILARDNGNEKRLSSTATLKLKILDINDNPPRFDQEQYDSVVPENASIGHVISQVSAESLDIGANAEMHYDITRGNERGKFEINQTSGQVRLVTKLDYESDQSYVLKVSAADHSDAPLTSDCTLRINVTDVNDNAPQFALPLYKVTLAEDSPLDQVITTVSASDRDSGPGGKVSYRLEASKGSPFDIDSSSGSLQLVAPGLDYEQQNFHRITVVASDAGLPALHNRVIVDVFVTDVNDNRPVFDVRSPLGDDNGDVSCSQDGANCTVYVHESTETPVTAGIASLNATDADSAINGGPFKFRILEGNSKGLFYLDEANILKSRSPFKLNENSLVNSAVKKQLYLLRISVEDSGKPFPLSGQPNLTLRIIVLKENLYPPEIIPHRVKITTADGQFSGGPIAQKLYATDQDVFDQNRIRFALANSEDFEQFVIDPMTGALSAHSPIPLGNRNVTVRVSDGTHASFSTVAITVNQIKQKVLKDSVSIAFSGINTLEDYLASYHIVFVRKLKKAMPNNFNAERDLVVISLQLRRRNIELLFGIRMPPDGLKRDFYSSKSLRGFLESSRGFLMEDGTGLEVEWIDGTACRDENCKGTCRQNPTLMSFSADGQKPPLPVSTNTNSWVTPTFSRKKTCVCPRGTVGKHCESVCAPTNNPCPKNRVCTVVEQESLGYRCEAPTPNDTVMAFTGRAYAQYTIDGARRLSQFRVGFRLRTYQLSGIIFHADGPKQHFSRLETVRGLFRFTFDCGNGPQEITQTLTPVSDGQWHEVFIESWLHKESNLWRFKLTIDESFITSAMVLGGEPRINLSRITFGGLPIQRKTKRSLKLGHEKRHAGQSQLVKQGFLGCLRNVNFNDVPLTLRTKAGLHVSKMLNVGEKCNTALIDMGACRNSPCLNGGLCLPLPDGSHECQCAPTYYGSQCEIHSACVASPCKNQGYCFSDGMDFQCHCGLNFIGDRCEIAICAGLGSCFNGGICKNNPKGISSCECPLGWSGSNCNINLNECKKRCGSEKFCDVVNGKYVCNCSTSKDITCKSSTVDHDLPVTTSSFSWLYIVFGGLALLIISVVILVWICCAKKRKKKGSYANDSTSDPFIPPRIPPIPERPVDYQRSSRDSFNFDVQDEQDLRNRQVGYVLPQFPPTSQNTSAASDNDSIKKPSPSWPEYDSAAYYDKSVPSSVRQFSDSRKSSSQSNTEQPSFHWDDTDLKTGSLASPVPSHGQYVESDRSRPNYPPVSPSCYNSTNSSSTHRSHKTSALSGHYTSNGRARAEKQLIQMIKMDKNIREDEGIELKVREYLTQALKPQNSRQCNSNTSSFQSLPSSQQSAFRQFSKSNSPYPSSTHYASYTPESSDISDSECNPCEVQEPLLKLNAVRGCHPQNQFGSSAAPKSSDAKLPISPSDYELRPLHGDEEDSESLRAVRLPPATSNKSYSSLLDSTFQVELPTPTAARKRPFHPDQYLVDHARNISDLSLATESAGGSSYSVNGPQFDLRDYNRITPRPPQRRDSERLAMSSLSEEEDEKVAYSNLPRSKALPYRPPIHPSRKFRRHQRVVGGSKHNQTGGVHTPQIPVKNMSNQLYSPNATDV